MGRGGGVILRPPVRPLSLIHTLLEERKSKFKVEEIIKFYVVAENIINNWNICTTVYELKGQSYEIFYRWFLSSNVFLWATVSHHKVLSHQLTSRRQRHREGITPQCLQRFRSRNLGVFAIVCENVQGCESVV